MGLICLLAASWAAAPPPPPIVNGTKTSDYPEVVLLYSVASNGMAAGCTGSLINDEWVLAASHCIARSSLGFDPDEVVVIVGPDYDHAEQGQYASAWYEHPDYNGSDGYNDVSLIQLPTKLRNVPLMPVNDEALRTGWIGETVRLVGYGATGDNDSSTNSTKRMTEVPINTFDSRLVVTYDDSGKNNTNACHGDSGGPVLRLREDGGYETMGVMDFVYGNYSDCEGNGLASARVDYFLDWIHEYTDTFTYEELNPESDTDTDADTDTDTDADGDSDTDADTTDGPFDDPKHPKDVGEDYVSTGLCAVADPAGLGWLALGLSLVAIRRRQSA